MKIAGHNMSKIKEKVLEWLEGQNLEFTVQAETFVIDGDGPKPFKYIPNFIVVGKRYHGRVVIVEPITSFAPQGGLKRVQTFRRQFHSKYYVVIITKRRMLDRIPDDAYDQLLIFEELDGSFIKFR